jgi:hypothetical protein
MMVSGATHSFPRLHYATIFLSTKKEKGKETMANIQACLLYVYLKKSLHARHFFRCIIIRISVNK